MTVDGGVNGDVFSALFGDSDETPADTVTVTEEHIPDSDETPADTATEGHLNRDETPDSDETPAETPEETSDAPSGAHTV